MPRQFDTNQSQMCALAVLDRCLSVAACGFSWLLWRPAMLLGEWPCGSWGHGGSNHAMWIMGSGVASVRPREVHEIFSCSGVCSIAVSIC